MNFVKCNHSRGYPPYFGAVTCVTHCSVNGIIGPFHKLVRSRNEPTPSFPRKLLAHRGDSLSANNVFHNRIRGPEIRREVRVGNTDDRREESMRIHLVAVYLAACSIPAIASSDGGYCTIPKLVPGIPSEVTLENIETPFCGFALIEGRYQKLADVTDHHVEGRVTCSNTGLCKKSVQYFSRNENKKDPYIINFSGPKKPVGV